MDMIIPTWGAVGTIPGDGGDGAVGLGVGAEGAVSVSPMVWSQVWRDATRACRARLSACSVAMKGSLDADVILKIALQMHILQMMITTMEVAIRAKIFQNHLNLSLSLSFALSAIIFSFLNS